MLQSGTKLLAERHDLFPANASAPFHDVVERLAVNELHDEERLILQLAGADQLDDVRISELLENARLALEARECGILGEAWRHHLDGHFLSGLLMRSPI